MKYGKPLNFEPVAIKYPKLRICIGHMGWPFIFDTAAMLLKYPNVYADTSMLYMDSPEQFMHDVFMKQYGRLWLDNDLGDKIMFGSNNPRFRTARIKRGLESLDIRPETLELSLIHIYPLVEKVVTELAVLDYGDHVHGIFIDEKNKS